MEDRERNGTASRPGEGDFDSLPFPVPEIIDTKSVPASFK